MSRSLAIVTIDQPNRGSQSAISPDGRQVLASSKIQVGSWVKLKRGLRSSPLEVLDVGTDWVMVWYQGGEKRIPLHLVEPTSETGQTQKDRDRIQTEALEEWDAVALQRAVKEFGSGVNLRPATWDQITQYNKAMKSGWVVLKGSKTVGYIWVGSRARDKRKALRAIPATDSDVTTKQGSPLRLQRDYGEDEMLNIEEMEKTLKKSSNMVTLKTWEHQHSRPEIREVPYKHAMAMASRGGFFKAQVIGDFDQILFENKAGFRAAGLMAFDDSEMFEEDETQDEIEDLSDDFELMALDDFEMSVNTFPHL